MSYRYTFLPEAKGKSLDEILAYFREIDEIPAYFCETTGDTLDAKPGPKAAGSEGATTPAEGGRTAAR